MNDEFLTQKEIEARYPSEWILVVDVETDEHLKILRGRVACHSKDRDDVYRRAIELKARSVAFLYTGSRKGMHFAL